jgi:hypothetical protein
MEIYRWSGDVWVEQTSLTLTGPSVDQSDDQFPIKVVSVTPSTQPDFLVTTLGASYPFTAIISDVTGQWGPVSFIPIGEAPQASVPLGTVSGNAITAQFNNCNPDCADGTTREEVFRYSALDKALVPITSTGEPNAASPSQPSDLTAPVTTPPPTTTTPETAALAYRDIQGHWSASGFDITVEPLPGYPGEVTIAEFGGEATATATEADFVGVQVGSGGLTLTYNFSIRPNVVVVNDGSSTYLAYRN